jgi:hypothetical protein
MGSKQILIAIAVLALSAPGAWAQTSTNNFFGQQSLPGGPPGDMSGAGYQPPQVQNSGGKSDFSDDEKRMQKKYKASVKHCKDLIDKGTAMMEDGERHHDDKTFKKGKIFKEIGERQLSELQANNPFPDTSKDKKGKDKDKDKDADKSADKS